MIKIEVREAISNRSDRPSFADEVAADMLDIHQSALTGGIDFKPHFPKIAKVFSSRSFLNYESSIHFVDTTIPC